MQIPLMSGIYTDNQANIRTAYPVNMISTPISSGISEGFLRPADGIVSNGTGVDIDRGGINWKGICYRVMGSKLVTVGSDGVVTVLGDVGGTSDNLVSFDYSFDRLAICSNQNLYYWDGTTLTHVTDGDLGVVLDVIWIDGYFMTTDGTSIVVTELNDPTQVNPLKYGSSEVDPDPIVALIKIRDEAYAINRNTIEVFDNKGGDFFPFFRNAGAQIQKGAIGTHACCEFMEAIAFVGSGRNETLGIYLGHNAKAEKISTNEIDRLLRTYTESDLAKIKVESRKDKSHQFLYIHLPDRTIVFDFASSQATKTPIWFVLTTATADFSQYRARNFVWCYDKWLVGDPQSTAIGYFTENVGSHWGQKIRWELATLIMYNESNGAIFNELELVALTGRIALGSNPIITTSYSLDGEAWSQDKSIYAGQIGNTKKRLVWFRNGIMRNWRIQRFRGDSDAHISVARLEAQLEPLAA